VPEPKGSRRVPARRVHARERDAVRPGGRHPCARARAGSSSGSLCSLGRRSRWGVSEGSARRGAGRRLTGILRDREMACHREDVVGIDHARVAGGRAREGALAEMVGGPGKGWGWCLDTEASRRRNAPRGAMRHCEPSPDVQLSVVRALPRAPCRTPTPDPRDAVSSTGSFRLTTAAAMAASAWESPCRDTTRLRAYASRRSGDGVCPSRPEDRTMSIHAPSPSAPSRARHGDPRLDTVG
jgi:hypothetical protein